MNRKIARAFICFLLTVLVSNPSVAQQQRSNNANAQVVNSDIKVQRKRRGIDAELVDEGDYYMHPDGRRIRMLRKKDVYVIESDDTGRSMERVKGQYGERVKDVEGHLLGGRKVVKIDNGQLVKRQRNEQYDVSAQMLMSSDNSIRKLKSVFTNEQGDGDILLMSKLTVKLADGFDPTAALNRLDSQYGLELDRKLRVTGNVYSLSLKTEKTESQQFALVRSVMNDVMVEWAEPQFESKPYKMLFGSADPLAWHLRNTGLEGSLCDSDCDANNAWSLGDNNSDGDLDDGGDDPAFAGEGVVIAILDDGVQLDHPDFNIWNNPGETNSNNSSDEDTNGYIDDWQGWDFVNDSATNSNLKLTSFDVAGTCSTGVDGTPGEDNDPSPQAASTCVTVGGSDVDDHHGTAVAGLAAATGNNGVVGTAFKAEILPIRVISDFDESSVSAFCITIAEAMAYAGRYADVINNSWGMEDTCITLETTISEVTTGTLMDGGTNVSKRKSTDTGSGSPVLFASGNSGSGWVKVTVPISAGDNAYEWRYLRSAFPSLYDSTAEDDSAWVDEITWSDQTIEGFESGLGGFDAVNELNSACDANCDAFYLGLASWSIETNAAYVYSGSQAAKIDASGTDCGNTYLYTLRENESAGQMSFWVWVSTNGEDLSDSFELLINGEEVFSFGDIAQVTDNEVGYPASLATTIAVGASDSGDLSGEAGASLSNSARLGLEKRAFYTQYGAPTAGVGVDVLAPSSSQHLGISTTDRTGSDGYESSDYTSTFGGTSASTPIVAGIAAAIIAVDDDLDASEVADILRDTANEIGGVTYDVNGWNEFYGYGRVNMLNALQNAAGISETDPAGVCAPDVFSYTYNNDLVLGGFAPQSGEFCPAIGEVPEDDELCLPIKTSNGNIAVICL